MAEYQNHQWEEIYRREGRVFTNLLPAFHEAVEKFKDNNCRTILDLGCGNGRHLVGFGGAGFDVHGIDISTTGLNLSRAWLNEAGLTAGLVCGDTRQNLPFANNSFKAVFSTQVIHHAMLKEIRHTIREIWRILDDTGLAFITVAARTHKDTTYEEIEPGTFIPLEGDEKGLPHHIFSPKELRKEFSRFDVLDLDHRADGRVLIIWGRKNTP